MEVVMSVGIGLLSAASSLLILSGDGELRSDWDELGRTRDRTVTWARGMRASIVGRAEERGLALPGSRKKRERLEGAMVEAFGALAASMASGSRLRRRCGTWALMRKNPFARSSCVPRPKSRVVPG